MSIPGWCRSSCLACCGGGAVRTASPCWSYSPSMAIASAFSSPSRYILLVEKGRERGREGEGEKPNPKGITCIPLDAMGDQQ